jgi:hypothetical protein
MIERRRKMLCVIPVRAALSSIAGRKINAVWDKK